MTLKERTSDAKRPSISSMRKTALVAGVLYLITFIASIPAVFLLGPVITDPAYILGPGNDTQVLFGAFLELVTALSGIGTAVALYSVIRRQSKAASIGFITTRTFEGAVIVIGVVSIMAVVALRQAGPAAGTDSSALVAVSQGLVGVRHASFLIGPGIMPGFNALLLGYALYQSRLVPRLIPAVGLIGAPVFLVSASLVVIGLNGEVSVLSAIALVPIFFWELSVGLWMTFKGFRKEAPLMVEAAAEDASLADSASVSRSSIGAASKVGAA